MPIKILILYLRYHNAPIMELTSFTIRKIAYMSLYEVNMATIFHTYSDTGFSRRTRVSWESNRTLPEKRNASDWH